jgi:hypothetical protein
MKKVMSELFKNESISDPITKQLKLPNPIEVECRRVGLKSKGVANECHNNVVKMVYAYGGSVLTGLAIDEMPRLGMRRYYGHSVWLTPEGRAVCLTLGHLDEDIMFVPLFIHNQKDVQEMYGNDDIDLPVPLSFLVNHHLQWMIFNYPLSHKVAMEFLSNPRKKLKRMFPKIVKIFRRMGVQDWVGHPKIRDIKKTIIGHHTYAGISSDFDIFLPGVKLGICKRLSNADSSIQ